MREMRDVGEMTRLLVAQPAPMSDGAREFDRVEWLISERPLLHACCNTDDFGDVRLDIRPEVHPDVVADIREPLRFGDDAFSAWFADFPWSAAFKTDVARSMKNLMRVAPIGYSISPWTYGAGWIELV